ncbi:predicted protein, partial [Nematostella vectensis]
MALNIGYIAIAFFSIIGNSLIISIIHRTPNMRTATNLLILNMAISDLLIPIVYVPLHLYYRFNGPAWHIHGALGSIFCHLSVFLISVSISVSILSMVAIAFDRFFAVLFPLKAKLRTTRSRILTIATIWDLSFAF